MISAAVCRCYDLGTGLEPRACHCSRAATPVKLKLAAYPFQKYGMLEGAVKTIAADVCSAAQQDPKASGPVDVGFKATVVLNAQQLTARGQPFVLNPGMQVVAESRQGERTVLEYLLNPVQKIIQESGRER